MINLGAYFAQSYGLLEMINNEINTKTSDMSFMDVVILIICIALALERLLERPPTVTNAVYHGYSSWMEPTFLLRGRFIFNARVLIASGSVKWKDRPFVLRRWDLDVTVFPNKYIEELRAYPANKISGIHAHIGNMIPRWTYSELLVRSSVHFRVLLREVTPSLSKYLDIAHDELQYGWQLDMPKHTTQGWTEFDIQSGIRTSVARMTARLFLGQPACRRQEWLSLSTRLSIEFFACAFVLRKIPSWLHPIVAPVLPLRWRVAKALKLSTEIVGPLASRHLNVVQRRATGEEVEEEEVLLHWMIDNCTEVESTIEDHAHRQAFVTLASIFTTSTTVSNLLFDLCTQPEWIDVLKEEVEEIEKELGKFGERPGIGAEQWLPRLEKMDSAIVESLRLSPPLLLANQRQALVSVTLKDGTHIPAGTRIACAKADVVYIDPAVRSFDPMRWYRKRRDTGELNKHLAVVPEKEYIHFGFGRQACPGRHIAIGMVKMLMVELLSDYEFRYPEGKGRPKNFSADEYCFLDPRAKLLVRRKDDEDKRPGFI